MKLGPVFYLAVAIGASSPAFAMDSDPPGFPNVDPVVAAARAGITGATARWLVTEENNAREAALATWPELPSDVQTHCVIVAKLSVPEHILYQSLYNCLSELAYRQHELGGEIPLSIRKAWLDNDIRSLKAGHILY
jgi:hypothetical protein